MSQSRFEVLSEQAANYGEKALEHYSLVRSLAEQIREGFCKYMGHSKPCVFLVPPKGNFVAHNYGSQAFSVAGAGFLPLGPIAFGLAVRVSTTGDFMRLVLIASKTGHQMAVRMDGREAHHFDIPFEADQLEGFFDYLYTHLMNWFKDSTERYEHGDYGSSDIGFDFQRIDEDG